MTAGGASVPAVPTATVDARRLFVGVPVSVPVAQALAATGESLARRASTRGVALRWVSPASYHVTLRFLGWCRPALVPALEAAMERAAVGIAPLRLRVARLGAFPDRTRATVVWAGVDDATGDLERVAAAIEQEAVALGFTPERRRFHPHVTLARVREPVDVDDVLLPFSEQVFSESRCDSLVLFESSNESNISAYRPVAKKPLLGPGAGRERQSEAVQTGSLDVASSSDDGWDKHPGG